MINANVRFWHKADRQITHSGISPLHPIPHPTIPHSSSAPGVAVGVNPQSGSHNHHHNANVWPIPQRNPLFI